MNKESKLKLDKLNEYAIAAMQGILSDADNQIAPDWDKVAEHSFDCAKAMFKAFKKMERKIIKKEDN